VLVLPPLHDVRRARAPETCTLSRAHPAAACSSESLQACEGGVFVLPLHGSVAAAATTATPTARSSLDRVSPATARRSGEHCAPAMPPSTSATAYSGIAPLSPPHRARRSSRRLAPRWPRRRACARARRSRQAAAPTAARCAGADVPCGGSGGAPVVGFAVLCGMRGCDAWGWLLVGSGASRMRVRAARCSGRRKASAVTTRRYNPTAGPTAQSVMRRRRARRTGQRRS